MISKYTVYQNNYNILANKRQTHNT